MITSKNVAENQRTGVLFAFFFLKKIHVVGHCSFTGYPADQF
jgi:hypothetical protein